MAQVPGMTDWENRYQVGDMPWDKGRAAPPLLELLGRRDAGLWGEGPVLVPGCGLGHDVRALAALGNEVVGLDISRTAVERAEDFPVVGRESYEHADFLNPAWREGRNFSALWEHTCFCAIPPTARGRYAAEAAECLGDGGLLAGVFFLTPFDKGEEEEGPPFATSIEEVETWFAPWFDRVDGWVPELSYPGREGREWLGLFQKRANA